MSVASQTQGMLVKQFACADDIYHHIYNHDPEYNLILMGGMRPLPSNFGKLSATSTQDYDDDGLLDVKEINFSLKDKNGNRLVSITGTNNVILPSFKQCVDSSGGDLFYVREGLTRYCQENDDNDPFVSLNTVKILPIISDPTSADGDGDGINDNGDHYPLCIEDYNIHKHNIYLSEDGNYRCYDCDIKITPPDMQDKDILDEDDYLKVLCLKNEFNNYLFKTYGDEVSLEELKEAYLSSLYICAIEEIRLDEKYAYQYDYKGGNGKYYSEFMSEVNVDKLKNEYDLNGKLESSINVYSRAVTITEKNELKYKYLFEYAPDTCYVVGLALTLSSNPFISIVAGASFSSIPPIMYEEYNIKDFGWTCLINLVSSKIPTFFVKCSSIVLDQSKTVAQTDMSDKHINEGDKLIYITYTWNYETSLNTYREQAMTYIKIYWFRDGNLIFYED